MTGILSERDDGQTDGRTDRRTDRRTDGKKCSKGCLVPAKKHKKLVF